MERNISILEVIRIIIKKLWLIVLLVILGGAVGYYISSYIIDPYYTARISMVVSNSTTQSTVITTQDQTSAESLLDTISVIMKSDVVTQSVLQESGLQGIYSTNEIISMLTISSIEDTQVMEIKVTCNDPNHAAKIANTYLVVAPTQMQSIVAAGSVSQLDTASVPKDSSGPDKLMWTVLCAVIFSVIGTFCVLAIYFFDNRIKSEKDVEDICIIPIVGTIPRVIKVK